MDVLTFGDINTMSTEVITKLSLKVPIHDLELLFEALAEVLSKLFGQAYISLTILLVDLHAKTNVVLNMQFPGTFRKSILKSTCIVFIDIALRWINRNGQQSGKATTSSIGGRRLFFSFFLFFRICSSLTDQCRTTKRAHAVQLWLVLPRVALRTVA